MKKKIALVGCSDPRPENRREEPERLKEILEAEGAEVVISPWIFGCPGMHPEQVKAAELMKHFADPEMDYIFDVSGGDLANTVLPELDYEVIGNSNAVFCGYSDLTTVLNAITAKTGRETINYQIRNLLHEKKTEQRAYLLDTLFPDRVSEKELACRFLRGETMQGRVLGGNIRCFLKLAGTPFWPDLRGAILLLEAYSGGTYLMTTFLNQLKQMGVFSQISGVLLGTFTMMEEKQLRPTMEELVLSIVPEPIPVAKTERIGHGRDALAIVVGREYQFREG